MTLPRRTLRTSCALLATVAAVPALLAQQATTISGTVVDQYGGAIQSATVVVRPQNAGAPATRLTADAAGRFSTGALPPGTYTVDAVATGFSMLHKTVDLADHAEVVSLPLALDSATEQITVEANSSNSAAAAYAPMDALLEARSARTEITAAFVQNFTSPFSDYSEVVQLAPGTFSVNPNGIGLGDSKTYFRGFKDGLYDITFDGIPWEDTNSPTHHSWAFFPAQWIGGVDFDRSPGDATTIGPTPFGGSINLLSRTPAPERNFRGGVSYGSYNTMLVHGEVDTGNFGGVQKRNNMLIDVHRLTSDGYQTLNAQQRWGGDLKYQLKINDRSTLVGFSGVLLLDSNTPNNTSSTRAAIAQFGQRFLLNSDPTSYLYTGYNYYHVPTDFEYVGYRTELPRNWTFESKPYTYSYNNAQYYANQVATISTSACAPVTAKGATVAISPCAVNKLNSYRKYGANSIATQTSSHGIFRTGLWYEWAKTDRVQTPSNPLTHVDDVLPNFHENFWTNSYQPYAEYEWHPTGKLTVSGGLKLAVYKVDLKQYADNGKTVGLLGNTTTNAAGVTTNFAGGSPFVRHTVYYHSVLPSADVNYRLRSNWSVYGQFATGSVIPPSSVFDSTGGTVTVTPQPTGAHTYQTGSVLKLKRVTLDADVYYTRFANAYVSSPDPNIQSAAQFSAGGDSVSKGFEGETNVYLYRGLSFFANGTVGTARYVSRQVTATLGGVTGLYDNSNYNRWVANTPANTQALGLTYQQKYLDFGIFNKRVGPMWNDATGVTTATATTPGFLGGTINQIIPIDPFNVTNMFFNYTVRNGGKLDNTKIRLSFNNLFNASNLTGATQATKANTYVQAAGDTLQYLPGRSVTLSVSFGFSPGR